MWLFSSPLMGRISGGAAYKVIWDQNKDRHQHKAKTGIWKKHLNKERMKGGSKKWNSPFILFFVKLWSTRCFVVETVWRLEKMTTCFLLFLSSLCLCSFLHPPPPLPLLPYSCLFLLQPCCFFCSLDYFICSSHCLPGAQMDIFGKCSQFDDTVIQHIQYIFLILSPSVPSFSFCTCWHSFY